MEVEELDDSFWNLSEFSFLNNEGVDGIQLTVDLDLNPAKVVKDSEKGKWKQKSIDKILGIPKQKKSEKNMQSCVLFRSTVAVVLYQFLLTASTGLA